MYLGWIQTCPNKCKDLTTNSVYQTFISDYEDEIKKCWYCGAVLFIPKELKEEKDFGNCEL